VQIKPSKTKTKIEAKKLGFPWFYSSESGLFNGLRRIQIKKIWPPSQVVCKTSQAAFLSFSGRWSGKARIRSAVEFVIADDHSPGFPFPQDNVDKSVNSLSLATGSERAKHSARFGRSRPWLRSA
jgi:hypothetical protein